MGFLDSTLNTHRKKLLLDQFAAEGSDVTATRIDHEAGTNFDRVYYSYRDEHGREYQKEYDVVLKTCVREPNYHRFFTVKVLNGYPKSGLPEVFVDSRSRDYGICNIVIGGLFCSMCIGGCPAFFWFAWSGDWSSVSLPLVLSSSAILVLSAIPVAMNRFNEWRNEILKGESYHRPNETTAEPVREGRCSAFPEAPVSYAHSNADRVNLFSEGSTAVPVVLAEVPSEGTYPTVASLTEAVPEETRPLHPTNDEGVTPATIKAYDRFYESIP